MPYITVKDVETLQRVYKDATLDGACFSVGDHIDRAKDEAFTQQVRVKTQLFRESWILNPLRTVLANIAYTPEERRVNPISKRYYLRNLRTGGKTLLGGTHNYHSAVTAAFLQVSSPSESTGSFEETIAYLEDRDLVVEVDAY